MPNCTILNSLLYWSCNRNIDYNNEAVAAFSAQCDEFIGSKLIMSNQKIRMLLRCMAYYDELKKLAYTFRLNYYWMMGDNRDNSADSRFWGFVPEDHVVGKPLFVWISLDPDYSIFSGGIRWNRFFKRVWDIR